VPPQVQHQASPLATTHAVPRPPETHVLAPDVNGATAVTQQIADLIERLLLTAPSAALPFRQQADTIDELLMSVDLGTEQFMLVRRRPLPDTHVSLSPRELAIARLVAKGLPNKCIGDMLDISPWTVSTHLRRIFTKLQVGSRAAMVARLTAQHLL